MQLVLFFLSVGVAWQLHKLGLKESECRAQQDKGAWGMAASQGWCTWLMLTATCASMYLAPHKWPA